MTSKQTEHKADRTEVLDAVWDVLNETTASPTENMRAMGHALVKLADVLEGVSVEEAKVVLRSVAILHGVNIDR